LHSQRGVRPSLTQLPRDEQVTPEQGSVSKEGAHEATTPAKATITVLQIKVGHAPM
jgi:hypothetical protein